jgi:SAM-dependent methyltransferase
MLMEFVRIADIKRKNFIVGAVKKNCAPGATVLDIGCGNGIVSRAIGRAGYHITGIDVSEKTIARAVAENDLDNVEFKVVGASQLKAEPGRYDAIICSEVLEHLHEPAELLSILYSSLKDNGVLVVTVPNGRGPREFFVTRPVQSLQKNNGLTWRAVNKLKSAMGYKGVTVQSAADDLTHVQFFTINSLKALAASSGFYIEKITSSNFIEQVFPFSLLFKRSSFLQKIDCVVADMLPLQFSSGFMSTWKKCL